MEAALAGLTIMDAGEWLARFDGFIQLPGFEWEDAMPSADEILTGGLELVAKIAGLEVPDA